MSRSWSLESLLRASSHTLSDAMPSYAWRLHAGETRPCRTTRCGGLEAWFSTALDIEEGTGWCL